MCCGMHSISPADNDARRCIPSTSAPYLLVSMQTIWKTTAPPARTYVNCLSPFWNRTNGRIVVSLAAWKSPSQLLKTFKTCSQRRKDFTSGARELRKAPLFTFVYSQKKCMDDSWMTHSLSIEKLRRKHPGEYQHRKTQNTELNWDD